MVKRHILPLVAVGFCAPLTARATILYSQNFDVDDTPNWSVNNNGLGTNAANFFFDYSTIGIPSAPNSGGTTIGMKLGSNLDPATAPTSTSQIPGISVSPTGKSFTGNYRLRFDCWSNFIGPLNVGAAGSTELTNFGIMSSGTTANYPGVADGVWFGATGDGQSSSDYRIYSPERTSSYDIFATSANPLDAHVVYVAGSRNQSATLYMTTFPAGATAPGSQSGISTQSSSTPAGAFGFRWHDVIIDKVGNTIGWTVDGVLLATVDATNFTVPTAGSNILFGQSDTNNTTNPSASALAQLQFGLIDNVRVDDVVPEPGSLMLLGAATVGILARRKSR